MSRSFLFVPGDSEKKLHKAAEGNADALIIDLEDSVAATERPRARELTRNFLQASSTLQVWVRINPLQSADAKADLHAVMPEAPAGIVVPKPQRAADIVGLAKLLTRLEKEHELPQGKTRILPIATEQPLALFHLHEYAGATERLAGLTWGAEDLSAAIGATANRDETGNWLPPYELARSLCLIAAAGAGVAAIDTVFTDFRNSKGLAGYAARARRDGFRGMLAIHPAQVDTINEAFAPSTAEIERARHIVALFADNPGSGTLAMNGEMLDRPHLLQAERILEIAAQVNERLNSKAG